MGRVLSSLSSKKKLWEFIILIFQLVLIISSLGAINSSDLMNLDNRLAHPAGLLLPSIPLSEVSVVVSGEQNQPAKQSFKIYLPVLERSVVNSPGDDVSLAIERVNHYRSLAGVASLRIQESVVEAAQNHADYYMFNFADGQAWEHGVHGEVMGKPGFSGKWPYDRMQATQYPGFGSAEVMHFIGDPIASVDGWMSGILHRVILLEPILTCGGYGSGKNEQAAVDVINLGIGDNVDNQLANSSPYPLSYPADGQQGVPLAWNGNESPDPLPAGASRPVGYPFTLQGVMGKLVVDWAEMRSGAGQVVAVHPNPPLCPQFNCYALIPRQPLSPWSTYSVTVQGSVAGIAFTRSWTFTTGGSSVSADLNSLAGDWVAPSLPQPLISGNLASLSSD
jgi:uncharacterized protein YkwD